MSKVLKLNNKTVHRINSKNVNTFNGTSITSGITPCTLTVHGYRNTITGLPDKMVRGTTYSGRYDNNTNCEVYGITGITNNKSYKFDDGSLTISEVMTQGTQNISIASCKDTADLYVYSLLKYPIINPVSTENTSMSVAAIGNGSSAFTPNSQSGCYLSVNILVASNYILDTINFSNIVGDSTLISPYSEFYSVRATSTNSYSLNYTYRIHYNSNKPLPTPFSSIGESSLTSLSAQATVKTPPNLRGTTWVFKDSIRDAVTSFTPVEGERHNDKIPYSGYLTAPFSSNGLSFSGISLLYNRGDGPKIYDDANMTYNGDSSQQAWTYAGGSTIGSGESWNGSYKQITFSSTTDIYNATFYEFLMKAAVQQ